MAAPYIVAVEGLDDLPDFDQIPKNLKRYASRAVNTIARRYRTEGSRAIREQVAFPARYLDSRNGGRLAVTQFADPASLEATITGRAEPTSLARFLRGSRRVGRRGATVQVAPGRSRKMARAFVMGLKSNNVGLAIRLRAGERLQNKRMAVRAYSLRGKERRGSDYDIYLLYGPSVDQVFRDVAEDMAPGAEIDLEREFLRIMEVLI